jgi:hypothetical protein
MRICFTINGVRHCYLIPILAWPIHVPKVGPGPVNYPPFIVDAIVIGSIYQATTQIGDERVRDELRRGVTEAIAVLKERAGEHAEIELVEEAID